MWKRFPVAYEKATGMPYWAAGCAGFCNVFMKQGIVFPDRKSEGDLLFALTWEGGSITRYGLASLHISGNSTQKGAKWKGRVTFWLCSNVSF